MKSLIRWGCLWLVWTALAVMAVPVTAVRVTSRGPVPVDEPFVRTHLSVRPGDEFDRLAVNRDVRALQKTERFSFVEAVAESGSDGIILEYELQGRPLVRNLRVDGADLIGNKKAAELMAIQPGKAIDDGVLAASALKVTELYARKYYPDAKVTWTVTPVADNPVYADVRVKVSEGKCVVVRRILFEGNRSVPRRDLLRVMKQKQSNWLSIITNEGRYQPYDLESDVELIRQSFLNKGLLDVEVSDPELKRIGTKRVDIIIRIKEGQPYALESIGIDGATLFPDQALMAQIRIRPGGEASMSGIQSAAQALRDYYGSRGYIRTAVEPVVDADASRHMAQVRFKVAEGPLAYIRNIFIRGNTRTKDKVIRRELSVAPGDIFNEVKVRTSEQRVQNLGYFSYVRQSPQNTLRLDQYDLVFDVEEQKTGQFMIGAGLSSIDAIVGFVELSQGNFDLFGWPFFTGGGQKAKLRLQLGTKRSDVEVSFIEPWFLDRKLSLGLDLYRHDYQFYSDEYNQSDLGGRITLGKAITSYDRINVSYGLEWIDIYDVSTNASPYIQEEAGTRSKSAVTMELVHDSRNNAFIPTRGTRASVMGQVAGGPLGGQTDLYKLEARTSMFFPLWFEHVLNVRGWVAVVDPYGDSNRVPIYDRLFLGGARTMRGFDFREVGPKDENGEPLGGDTAFFASLEYLLPVFPRVRLAVFYDIGMVWQDPYQMDFGSLNSDAGVGVRLDIPGFPIQLDYGWPIEADEWNDRSQGRFNFWIGYTY